MVLQPVFVAHHLAIQFVHQFIHRGIQVFVRAFCKHVIALHVDIALGTLPSFLYASQVAWLPGV